MGNWQKNGWKISTGERHDLFEWKELHYDNLLDGNYTTYEKKNIHKAVRPNFHVHNMEVYNMEDGVFSCIWDGAARRVLDSGTRWLM